MSQTTSLVAAARQDQQDNYVNPFETLSFDDGVLTAGDLEQSPELEGDVIAGFSVPTRVSSGPLPDLAKQPPHRRWSAGAQQTAKPTAAGRVSSTDALKKHKVVRPKKKKGAAAFRRRQTEPLIIAAPNPFDFDSAPMAAPSTDTEKKSGEAEFDDFFTLFETPAQTTSSAAAAADPFASFDDPFAGFGGAKVKATAKVGMGLFEDDSKELEETTHGSKRRKSKTMKKKKKKKGKKADSGSLDDDSDDDSLSELSVGQGEEEELPAYTARRKRGHKSRASAPAADIERARKELMKSGTLERERGVDPRKEGVGFRVNEDAIHAHGEESMSEGTVERDEDSSDSYGDGAGDEVRSAPKLSTATSTEKTSAATAAEDSEADKSATADGKKSATGTGLQSVGPAKQYNVLPELTRGTALLKYGKRGYPHFRQFNLSKDHSKLVWFTQKKSLGQSCIDVGSINEVLSGQHTKAFKRIGWVTLAPASFSIIYAKKKKNLNLVAKSVDEMKMWTKALRKLRDLKRKGQDVSLLKELKVDVDFRDRNRPSTRKHSGKFLRGHETKEREVDPALHRRLIEDVEKLCVQLREVHALSRDEIVMKSHEATSIIQILSELEERIDELRHEVKNTRNTKIAENDVWRTRVDLESLKDKIRVLIKTGKKRRWSIF